MKKIIQKDNPLLREKSKLVPPSDFGSPKLTKHLADMSEALASCHDGVALAAPQIGLLLKIFIVSHKLFNDESTDDVVFINPVVTKLSKKLKTLDEGCLSVRHVYGKIKRAEKATVEAYDEHGHKFSWNASGLMAQIFQHETDHLEGVLFIDKATDLTKDSHDLI